MGGREGASRVEAQMADMAEPSQVRGRALIDCSRSGGGEAVEAMIVRHSPGILLVQPFHRPPSHAQHVRTLGHA
jgi:hypothetical protein